jgi:hypothetical protein
LIRWSLLLLLVPSLALAQFTQPFAAGGVYDQTLLNSMFRDIYDHMGTHFSTAKAGLVPVSPGGATLFLNADGDWASVTGTGGTTGTTGPAGTPGAAGDVVHWLAAPDAVGDWPMYWTSNALVDLSDDGVPTGSSSAIIDLMVDAGGGNDESAYICLPSRNTGSGDGVFFSTGWVGGPYSKDRVGRVMVGVDSLSHIRVTISGTNYMYAWVVGYVGAP